MRSKNERKGSLLDDEIVSESKFRRLKWRMLLAAMFCYLFMYTGRQTFGFAIPGIEEDLGISTTTLGAISGLLLWTYAIGQAVNGNLADKFGGRRMMAGGAVLSTLLNWFTSFSAGPKTLGLFWGANGFAQAMAWPSGGRVIANWWGPHERGTSYGLYTFAAGCASILAFVTSTVIVDVFGLDWEWIFRGPVILMLIGGVVFYFVARDKPSDLGVVAPESLQADVDNPEHNLEGSEHASSAARYKAVLSIRKIWSTGVAVGFLNAARYGLLIWVPVYFLGGSWEETGGQAGISPVWISVALPIGMAVGAFANGQISDRLFASRRDYPIAVFMGLGAIAAMTMYLAPLSATGGVVVLFLTGFLVYGPQSSFWALCPDLAGSKLAGTAIGIVNFFSYFFAGILEPTIGRVIDETGDASYVFPIVAGSCVVSAMAALTIRR